MTSVQILHTINEWDTTPKFRILAMFVNADFQTIQFNSLRPRILTLCISISQRQSFMASRHHNKSQKKVRTGAVWFTSCENITWKKKSCPFLQTCHLGTLQRKSRRCRFGHRSLGARHVVITDRTGKKKMHAVGMSSNGGMFIRRFANIGWLVHLRKWRAKFNTWYFDIDIFQFLFHGSWNCSRVLVTVHSIAIAKCRLLYCPTDPLRCAHVSYSYHLCSTCPIYYLCRSQ